MRLSAITFRIHRWLGWLVGVQVLLWVSGGVFFALVPFQAWVKGVDSVKPPAVLLPAGWAERAAPVERLATVPRRLGIVNETGGRGDLWRLRFGDALATRIYLDGRTGEFVVSRNEAWVWYDFFWRLRIMDYEGGEDFNGFLLRSASVVAWMLVIAGAVLAALAARRSWRAARRPAHS